MGPGGGQPRSPERVKNPNAWTPPDYLVPNAQPQDRESQGAPLAMTFLKFENFYFRPQKSIPVRKFSLNLFFFSSFFSRFLHGLDYKTLPLSLGLGSRVPPLRAGRGPKRPREFSPGPGRDAAGESRLRPLNWGVRVCPKRRFLPFSMSFPVLIRWWSKQGRRAAASRRRRRAEAGAETLPRRGPARPQRGRSRRGGRQPGPRRLRRAARRAARAARAPRLPQHSREGESAPVANVAIENGFGERSAVCQRARGPPVRGPGAAAGSRAAGGLGAGAGRRSGRRGRGVGGGPLGPRGR